jgi:uncharacterized protein (DUF1015 family)
MPRFEPFAGLRYAPEVPLCDVTSPPYDVIDGAERALLASRSDANAVVFDLPDEADGPGRYERANAVLEALQEQGVLLTDDVPCFYGYRMTYPGGHTTGVIGGLELGAADVLPHEQTTKKAKSDRLDLLRATGHNLSAIWGLSLAKGLTDLVRTDADPDASCTDGDGVSHELWRIDDPDVLAAVAERVQSAPVVIADGHHRYETSIAYRDEVGGSGPHELTMALVVELTEDELDVRPIHRLLHGLDGIDLPGALGERCFEVSRLDAPEPSADGLVLVLPSGDAWLLAPRSGAFADDLPDLDSSRLDEALAGLPPHEVEYQHGDDNVVRRVTAGEASAGLLLRPAAVAQIAATAHGGDRMPPKTTFFWPKPRTGFVFRRLA